MNATFGPTEYTELQPLLSGVHSVMRVKSVLAGEGGAGARPPPFITSKVALCAPAEWADTLNLFHLYQNMYSVFGPIGIWCDGPFQHYEVLIPALFNEL
jgi:hypothetical protein